jgi:hypothetical protein
LAKFQAKFLSRANWSALSRTDKKVDWSRRFSNLDVGWMDIIGIHQEKVNIFDPID